MNYNERNAHPRDNDIFFDPEAHKYHLGSPEGPELASVTTVVSDCFEKFDAERWARRKTSSEAGAQALMKQWEAKGAEARDRGTRLHDRIERHYLGLPADNGPEPDDGFFNFLAFARTCTLTPFRSEWRIYSEKFRIAGTLDFLAFDGEKYEIYDWKRSTKVVDNFGQPCITNPWGNMAFPPLKHLHDTSYVHYALQLSLYRYILETEYGIEVDSAHLGVFHPSYSRPYIVDVPYLRDDVITLLNARV